MSIFSNSPTVKVTLPEHELSSSFGIIDCPKCARYIHVKYHDKCSAANIQHLHCDCACGYEFVNKPNDRDRYRFQK